MTASGIMPGIAGGRPPVTAPPRNMNLSAADVVVEVFRGSAEEWDAFVAQCPGATHCHRYGWRDIMARVFGHECLYLAARRNGTGLIDAILPLVWVRSPLFGRYLVSMPFLNYGGPVGSERGVAALVAEASQRGRRYKDSLVELRNRRPWPIAPGAKGPDPGWTVSTRKITVVRDLPGSGAQLWKQLDGKLRSQIRRPQKEGVQVRFGSDQVGPFFDVFARHMRDLGTPTQSKRFFEAVVAAFPEEVWVGCAYLGTEAIAAGLGFVCQSEFEMTWASALERHKQIAANMLLYWAFMERAAEGGLAAFNFGRCSPESGTHRFKRQWGSRDEQLWWYDWSRSETAKTPSPDDSAYAWGPRIWKHLPVPLASALGPRIVKYIP